MSENKITVVNSDFQGEIFGNEMLLYTLSDTQAVYLNETAHLVWQLCRERRTVGEVVTFFIENYPEQKDQVKKDVITTISSLVESNVLTLIDE